MAFGDWKISKFPEKAPQCAGHNGRRVYKQCMSTCVRVYVRIIEHVHGCYYHATATCRTYCTPRCLPVQPKQVNSVSSVEITKISKFYAGRQNTQKSVLKCIVVVDECFDCARRRHTNVRIQIAPFTVALTGLRGLWAATTFGWMNLAQRTQRTLEWTNNGIKIWSLFAEPGMWLAVCARHPVADVFPFSFRDLKDCETNLLF